MSDRETSVATVLTRWIRRQRLRPYELARMAGISRAHLWLMVNGRVSRPTPETLRKLAKGVATDPYEGTLDELVRDQVLSELSAAAGYPELVGTVDESELVQALVGVVGNHQLAGFWAELILAHRELSPAHQQLVRAVLELHTKPGGSEVVSLLLLLSAPDSPRKQALSKQLAALRHLQLTCV